jgi:hypothetical protein
MVLNATLEVELPPAEGMAIQISSADPAIASVPAGVMLAAGASRVSFPITLRQDALLNGSARTLITASAGSYLTATHALRVDDDETAALAMSLPAFLTEGETSAKGTVTASAPVDAAVTVHLLSSDTSELIIPATVTIPAGQSSVSFDLAAPEENLIDGLQPVTLTASVPNWTSGHATTEVRDNESTQITLELPSQAREGATGLTGRVRLGGVVPTDVTVSLVSSDETEITVPAGVLIPAGASEAVFTISAVNDVEADGLQNASITASSAGLLSGAASMSIRDDDAHHFTFATIPAQQVRNAPFEVSITARDAADAVVTDFEQTITLSGNAAVTPESLSGFVEGVWSGLVTVNEFKNGVVLTVMDAGGHTGSSNAFDVLLGTLHHFSWEAIEGPKTQDTPFAVTLTARDAGGNTVTGFTGSADLHAMSRPPERWVMSDQSQPLGFSTLPGSPQPYRWSMADLVFGKRVSQLLRPGQIGGPGVIESLFLDSQRSGSPHFDRFTVRMKHTTLASLETEAWDDSGWTVVHGGTPITPSHDGIFVELDTPFSFNGTDALLIDIQAQNDPASDSPHALTFSTQASSFVSTKWRTGDEAGTASATMLRMRLDMGRQPAKVFPLNAGPFIAGVWQGDVTIPLNNDGEITLRAKNGPAEGFSNAFAVSRLDLPPLEEPAPDALVLSMTANALEGGTSSLTISLPAAASNVPVTVNLSVVPAARSSLPASVVIPAGQSSVSVTAIWPDNTLLEGQLTLRMTASAAGFSPGELDVNVQDDELLPPVVTALPATMAENAGMASFVTINFAQPASRLMQIPLTSSPVNVLQHDEMLTLHPGEQQARLVVSPRNDNLIDTPPAKPVTLTLGLAGSPLAVLSTTVNDDEARTLSFDPFTASETTEGQLPVPNTRVSVSGSLAQPLEVTLTSSDPTQLSVPASVMVQTPTVGLPGGGGTIIINPVLMTPTTSNLIPLPIGTPILLPGFPSFTLNAMAEFPLTAVDNAVMDGSRVVTLTASAPGFTSATMQVTVRDNELHHLGISILEPGPKQVAVPFTTTLSARDLEDRVIAGNSFPLSLTPSSGAMTPSAVTLQNGLWQGRVAFLNAGSGMQFTAAHGAVSAISDPVEVQGTLQDDSDGDGESQFTELAFGKGRRPVLARGVDAVDGQPCLFLTHRRLRGAHGLTYRVEVSDDLLFWRPATAAEAVEVTPQVIELDPSAATQPVTLCIRVADPRVFVRVRAMVP